MKTVEVKVIDQKPFTPIHSHPLLSTPTHSHPLPSTAIHPQQLPPTLPTPIHLQLTVIYFHSFQPILLNLNPLSQCTASLTHFQATSKYSHPFQPIFISLRFTCLCTLRTCALIGLRISRANVPMQFISMHFTAYVYILYVLLFVLIDQDHLFTLRFLKRYL